MDTLTHAVLGLAIGWAAAGKPPPQDTTAQPLGAVKAATFRAVPLAAVMAAEAPDLDVFIRRIPGLEWVGHRGITHTFVAAPFIALIVTLLAKAVFRRARTETLYLVSLIALLVGHLFADVITYRGIRPLLPWSQWRWNWQIIPFIDLWVTLPLVAAALYGVVRPAQRWHAAVTVLGWLALYLGYRGLIYVL